MALLSGMITGCLAPQGDSAGRPLAPGRGVLAELDSAGALPFPRDRRERLHQLARVEVLSDAAQVRLIDTTMRVLADDEDREKVLAALIDNPAFSQAAEARLARCMDQIDSPVTRLQLLQSLNQRALQRQQETPSAPSD